MEERKRLPVRSKAWSSTYVVKLDGYRTDRKRWRDGWNATARASTPPDPGSFNPSITAFKELIANDAAVGMLVRRMVDQVPENRDYQGRHIRNVDHLLALINGVMDLAPEYGQENVTLPMGAVLDWTMGKPAGFAAYRDSRINAALKAILHEWCEFLTTPASLYVLNDSPQGWKGENARRDVDMTLYQHDPTDKHWGFASWNDFFTRRFVGGKRPVDSPDDDTVIVSACESTPFALKSDVKLRDTVWLKGQPYSLQEMLDDDESVEEFVGGTVYQAFLSATNYHRWHSPVAGTIARGHVVDGTYYSEADTMGSDATESTHSQGYLAHVATRAIVFIQADNPVIGLMAFLAVGISDVSSCTIDVTPGQHVAKGDELGYFQFGWLHPLPSVPARRYRRRQPQGNPPPGGPKRSARPGQFSDSHRCVRGPEVLTPQPSPGPTSATESAPPSTRPRTHRAGPGGWPLVSHVLPVAPGRSRPSTPNTRPSGNSATTSDGIKGFRELDSRCAGHPEYRRTSGLETTHGPLPKAWPPAWAWPPPAGG